MWGAATQNFNALLQLDPNNTQARIHRAKAQYNLVCTCMYTLFYNLVYVVRCMVLYKLVDLECDACMVCTKLMHVAPAVYS